jgi:hypothetical protein
MENVTRGRESLLAKSQNRTEQNRIYFAKITQGDIAKTGHTATYIYTEHSYTISNNTEL